MRTAWLLLKSTLEDWVPKKKLETKFPPKANSKPYIACKYNVMHGNTVSLGTT